MVANTNEFYRLFTLSPVFDYKALLEVQERNLEAMMAVNAKLVEGTQDMVRRQTEMVQGAIKESMETVRRALDGNAGAISLDKQFDYFTSSAEKAVASVRELTEVAGKTGTEAAEIWRKRATESVGEFTAMVKTAA